MMRVRLPPWPLTILCLLLGACAAQPPADAPAALPAPYPPPRSCATTPIPHPAARHGYPASWIEQHGIGFGIGQGVLFEGKNTVAWHNAGDAVARLGVRPAIRLSTVGITARKRRSRRSASPHPVAGVEAEGRNAHAEIFAVTVYVFPDACQRERRASIGSMPAAVCMPTE